MKSNKLRISLFTNKRSLKKSKTKIEPTLFLNSVIMTYITSFRSGCARPRDEHAAFWQAGTICHNICALRCAGHSLRTVSRSRRGSNLGVSLKRVCPHSHRLSRGEDIFPSGRPLDLGCFQVRESAFLPREEFAELPSLSVEKQRGEMSS